MNEHGWGPVARKCEQARAAAVRTGRTVVAPRKAQESDDAEILVRLEREGTVRQCKSDPAPSAFLIGCCRGRCAAGFVETSGVAQASAKSVLASRETWRAECINCTTQGSADHVLDHGLGGGLGDQTGEVSMKQLQFSVVGQRNGS